jgi:hypothetical protein
MDIKGGKMQVSAVQNQISFNGKIPKVKNKLKIKMAEGDNPKDKALVELLKYWEATGDFRPAQIDFSQNEIAKIKLIGKPSENIQKEHKENLLHKILNKITNIFKRK